jgi:hypothetical protein
MSGEGEREREWQGREKWHSVTLKKIVALGAREIWLTSWCLGTRDSIVVVEPTNERWVVKPNER